MSPFYYLNACEIMGLPHSTVYRTVEPSLSFSLARLGAVLCGNDTVNRARAFFVPAAIGGHA